MCDESPSCFKDETGWKKAILTISKQDMSSCGSKFDEVLNATEKLKEHRIDQRGNTAKLVSSIMYNHSKSEFTIKLSGLMTFYWVELSSYYSVQEINIASALTSRFSQVFYEMLCLDKTLKSTSLSVAELKNIIGIEEKYERVKDLRRYVIDRAYSEIKDLFDQKECDSYFSVVPVKSGRTITAFEFKIHRRTERNNVSKWSQKSESHFRFACEELIRYAGHDSRYVTNILRSIRGNSELTIQVARAIRKIIKYPQIRNL